MADLEPDWRIHVIIDVSDVLHRIYMVFMGKWALSRDELIEYDTNCPHIDTFCVTTTIQYLWCLIVDSTCICGHFPSMPSKHVHLRHTEINEPYSSICSIVQNILWFYVPVANSSWPQINQYFEQLSDDVFNLLVLEVGNCGQRWVWHVLHHQTTLSLFQIQVHGMVLHNTWVVQRTDGPELSLKGKEVLLFKTAEFDSVLSICFEVDTKFNVAIWSLSHFLFSQELLLEISDILGWSRFVNSHWNAVIRCKVFVGRTRLDKLFGLKFLDELSILQFLPQMF